MRKEDYSAYIQLLANINASRVPGLPTEPSLLFQLNRQVNKKSAWKKFRTRILIALCVIFCFLICISDRIVPGSSTRVITQVSNFPNPFDPEEGPTTITYRLDQDSPVTIIIYDLMGHLVQIFKIGPGRNGGRCGEHNKIPWDGTNQAGNLVARGGYLCRIMVESDQGIVQVIRKIGVYSQRQ